MYFTSKTLYYLFQMSKRCLSSLADEQLQISTKKTSNFAKKDVLKLLNDLIDKNQQLGFPYTKEIESLIYFIHSNSFSN